MSLMVAPRLETPTDVTSWAVTVLVLLLATGRIFDSSAMTQLRLSLMSQTGMLLLATGLRQ